MIAASRTVLGPVLGGGCLCCCPRSCGEQSPLCERWCAQRAVKGRIEPRPPIPIDQQVEAEQRREVREAPGPRGLELQELQQQHREQRDPDLHLHGVHRGPHEGLDLQMLLERFEQEFDLPPLLIEGGDRAGGQVHEVRQKRQPALLHLIPDAHLPQRHGTPVGGMQAGQANDLISQHWATGRHRTLLQDLIEHVGAGPRDASDVGEVQR